MEQSNDESDDRARIFFAHGATRIVETDRQKQVHDFICEAIVEHGFPPTIREIAKNFDIKSPNSVICQLQSPNTKGVDRSRRTTASSNSSFGVSEGPSDPPIGW